jgi:hypothetical protein
VDIAALHLPIYLPSMNAFTHWSLSALQVVLWTALLAGQSVPAPERRENCCEVIELRQYTLYPGKRDVLIDLFEREFVESQEALGMQLVGQFRDLDNPDRFVWLRGFRDMNTRKEALEGFYGGPVWKAHRDEANATMADSSNVLLLRAVDQASEFAQAGISRPPVGTSKRSNSVVVATIYYLAAPVDEAFVALFEKQLTPLMTETGAPPLAYFETETAENNFPRLPVRTGENVFVWFASFPNAEAYATHLHRLERTKVWNEKLQPELARFLKSPTQHLRLEPTPKSLLR